MANPLLNAIMEALAPQPRSYDQGDDPGFWTDGEEILCPSETECEVVAEFLRDLFSEHYTTTVSTGYHDMVGPEKRDHAGFYYIGFDREEA